MKNLKFIFCFLILVLGNNIYAQKDTIVKTVGFVDGTVNDANDTYRLSKYVANVEFDFHFTKDSIEINDYDHSVFKIKEKIAGVKVENEDELLNLFVCKDKKNISCYFFVFLDKDKNFYYRREYSNVVYFYYTKI